MLREEEKTIIRVWTATGNNVGHVSIELPHYSNNNYISLWPSAPATKKSGIFSPIPHSFMPTFSDDLVAEQRPPDVTIVLYSLQTDEMIAEYEAQCEALVSSGWQLISGTLFPYADGQSCASLAYVLLKKGGIYDLISAHFSSSFSSVSRPEELAKIVKSAKKTELSNYPETENYVYEGETEVNVETTLSPCSIQ